MSLLSFYDEDMKEKNYLETFTFPDIPWQPYPVYSVSEKGRVYNFKNEMTKKINLSDKEISGYEYEFIAARDAIIIGKPELPDVTHKDTISLLNFTDMLRRAWQIFYPLPGEETLKVNPNQNPNGKPDGPVPGVKRV